MNVKLQKFIEQNIDLIEENKFEELYDKLDLKFGNGYTWYITGEFTHACLSAGIDPMPYLRSLPPCYLATLQENTFLEEFRITDNIVCIDDDAFLDCPKIERVIIPKSVKIIEATAFGSSSIEQLIYEGTIEEFPRIQGDKYIMFQQASFDSIQCADGILSTSEFSKAPHHWVRDDL